jgi:hypothetical protein
MRQCSAETSTVAESYKVPLQSLVNKSEVHLDDGALSVIQMEGRAGRPCQLELAYSFWF